MYNLLIMVVCGQLVYMFIKCLF